jgi:SHS2 domain-containing protein
MKTFELINHTADSGAKIYGKDIEDLFSNASEALYYILSLTYTDRKNNIRIKVKSTGIENLLVKFLNELLYNVDVKKTAGKIKNMKIRREKDTTDKYILEGILKGNLIKKQMREIKAATYHNLKIEKKSGRLQTTVIFDI